MSVDALRSSHAISVRVKNPADALSQFDAISYDKGACLIRMIYYYVSPDVFRFVSSQSMPVDVTRISLSASL